MSHIIYRSSNRDGARGQMHPAKGAPAVQSAKGAETRPVRRAVSLTGVRGARAPQPPPDLTPPTGRGGVTGVMTGHYKTFK